MARRRGASGEGGVGGVAGGMFHVKHCRPERRNACNAAYRTMRESGHVWWGGGWRIYIRKGKVREG